MKNYIVGGKESIIFVRLPSTFHTFPNSYRHIVWKKQQQHNFIIYYVTEKVIELNIKLEDYILPKKSQSCKI